MKLSNLYLLLFLVFATYIGHAQQGVDCNYKRPHEADRWVFGNSAYLQFTEGEPDVIGSSSYPLQNGISSISDANGELLLFSNGVKVWNGNFQLVENGSGLKGNNFATQSSLIVPDPGDQNQYYVFTVDMYLPPVFDQGINYSIVSFKQNPAGKVIRKNNFLITKNSQKITGVKHANNHDYWVVTHGFGEDNGRNFDAWLVGDTGIVEHVQSKIGYKQYGDDNNSGGYMKFSPDGSKLALVVPADGVIELLDFDAETGEVSNPLDSPGTYDYPFGVEFSPDNSKLYVSTSPIGNATNYLYQFDLEETDPLNNPAVIKQFDVSSVGTKDSLMGALQLAVDGKIYLAKFRRGLLGKQYLGVIYNPDRAGAACNYNSIDNMANNGLYLDGTESLIGLPNFISSFLYIPHFTYYNQCHHDSTQFRITNTVNIEQADWDFDNPGGEIIHNDPYNPVYVFSDPGDYQIELSESFNGEDYFYTYPVRIHPLPYVDLGHGSDTMFILPNSSVRLDAGDYDFYYWEPGGSTERYLDVTAEGLYAVTVTDSNCCRNYDEVYVVYANIYFPSAIDPSSPVAINREFKVLGVTSSLAEYHLTVFNRWGQKVFETDDPAEGWNGTYQGESVSGGTYVWTSTYKSFESGAQESIEVVQKGTVTVVK